MPKLRTHNLQVRFTWALYCFAVAAWGQNNLDFTWTWRNPLPHAEYVTSAVWTGERIVASGIHASVLTSEDGLAWQIHDASGCVDRDHSLYSLVWTGRQVFALTWKGEVCQSADGLRWEMTNADTVPRRAMAWAGNQLVALGDKGLITTSPDGKSWTLRESGTSQNLTTLHWTGDSLIAGGEGGLLLSSQNGQTWKKQTLALPVNVLQIAQQKGMLLAIGYLDHLGGDTYCFQSADGKTWSDIPHRASGWRYLRALNGGFVATGIMNEVYVSEDGVTWNAFAIDTVRPTGFTEFIVVDERLMGFAWPGPAYQTSDGKNWTRMGSGFLGQLYAVAKGQNGFVAVGHEGVVMTSLNAVQWTQQPSITKAHLHKVIWARDRYYALSDYGSVFTSVNGREWQEKPTGFGVRLNSILWTGKEFVIVGNALAEQAGSEMRTSLILTSSDGENWKRQSMTTVVHLTDIAWSGSRFVAVGSHLPSLTDQILTSTDGVNWSAQHTSFSDIKSVHWGNGQFLIVSARQLLRVSPDGMQWQEIEMPTASFSAAWTGTHWVTGFESHRFFISSDGLHWQERQNPTSVNIYQMIWTGEQLLGVGALGCIFTAIPTLASIHSNPGIKRPQIKVRMQRPGLQVDGLGRQRKVATRLIRY